MVFLQDFHDRLRVEIAVGVVNFVVERVLMDSCSQYRDLVEWNRAGEIGIATYLCRGMPLCRRCGHGNPVFGFSSFRGMNRMSLGET